MRILAIETSCDETSSAVIDNSVVLSNIISSQYFHNKYGGVVPELASRAHLQSISSIVLQALETAGIDIESIDAIAVTTQPGLIGSLIVGSSFAKGLSLRYKIPIIPINHIEGHLFSGMIDNPEIEFPYIALVVSGGHTALFYVISYNKYDLIGTTIDDAAGEAFDKTAKLLGLGYPGGPEIDRLSNSGNSEFIAFPRSMIKSNDFNFSFSGLKTAVKYYLAKNYPNGVPDVIIPHICSSVQSAIIDVLLIKTIASAQRYSSRFIVVSGGVSANSYLRSRFEQETMKLGIKFVAPKISYCLDNAGMIGFIAEKRLMYSNKSDFYNLDFTTKAYTLKRESLNPKTGN